MIEIIDVLLKNNFYGGGKFIEIAKGKNELAENMTDFKQKIKRLWLLKK